MNERDDAKAAYEAFRAEGERIQKEYRRTALHNAKVHRQLLREYALERGITLLDPEWEAKAAAMRADDAGAGMRSRTANLSGRPPAPVPDEVLREEVLAIHEDHPSDSWSQVCAFVGRRHSLHGRTVRNRLPDTKW